jgi:hypothetical protein
MGSFLPGSTIAFTAHQPLCPNYTCCLLYIQSHPLPLCTHVVAKKHAVQTPFQRVWWGGEWLPWGVSNLEYVSLPVNTSFYAFFASAVLFFFWFVPFARRSWGVELASYRSTTCWDLKRVIWGDLWVFSLATTPTTLQACSKHYLNVPSTYGCYFSYVFFQFIPSNLVERCSLSPGQDVALLDCGAH